MPDGLTQRLLSVLQLARLALVFTAVADGVASLLLLTTLRPLDGGPFTAWRVLAAALMSVGLYGFGMTLNDIIDRRRDEQLAAHRPLPSGRIAVGTAHLVCAAFGLVALLAGVMLSQYQPSEARTMTLLLLIWTALLIAFYDFAGKYLVAPGLLTLGLIRFFHATVPAPQLPLVWHPLLLLNHVAILSTVCYHLEQKRPPLTRVHWWSVLGGLVFIDATCLGFVWWKRGGTAPDTLVESLGISARLWLPLAAVIVFAIVAVFIRRAIADSRTAGQTLMMYGLLWLIVYDAAFVAGHVGYVPALLILLLLPAGYVSVQLMRTWSRIVTLSQKPTYQRAR